LPPGVLFCRPAAARSSIFSLSFSILSTIFSLVPWMMALCLLMITVELLAVLLDSIGFDWRFDWLLTGFSIFAAMPFSPCYPFGHLVKR